MALKKRKSRTQQIAGTAIAYMKLKTAGKAARGAGKGAKKAATGTAVYKVASKTPLVKRIPLVLGAGVAALVATKVARDRGGEQATA